MIFFYKKKATLIKFFIKYAQVARTTRKNFKALIFS